MTLPDKANKEYLAIAPAAGGFVIVARKEHADELAALLEQRGHPCQRRPDVQPDHDALTFGADADRAGVQEVLDAYKRAKGS